MGDIMPHAPVGGGAFRCHRGCGQDIGHPENQDGHNYQAHLNPDYHTSKDERVSSIFAGPASLEK